MSAVFTDMAVEYALEDLPLPSSDRPRETRGAPSVGWIGEEFIAVGREIRLSISGEREAIPKALPRVMSAWRSLAVRDRDPSLVEQIDEAQIRGDWR